MIDCEVSFRNFDAHGSESYLASWAAEVDKMAAQGWQVMECCRPQLPSREWTVVFGRVRRIYCPPEN